MVLISFQFILIELPFELKRVSIGFTKVPIDFQLVLK